MQLLRTPDDRFEDLPGFPFEPRYVVIEDEAVADGPEGPGRIRVHHLDEGPSDGPVVLLMHGEPSWSYLYRHMVAPLTEAGLRACRALSAEGIRTNVTLCFSAPQALMAAKAGATYISPFVGRLDDVSGEGMQLISQIRQIYDNYDIETEILAASLRHPMHVVEAMLIGADCGTLPTKVLYQLLEHPLTDKGLAAFMADWQKLGKDL